MTLTPGAEGAEKRSENCIGLRFAGAQVYNMGKIVVQEMASYADWVGYKLN
jgi:hypothetical protein